MRSIKEIIKSKDLKSDHRNVYEFQAYGNRLAEELNDTQRRSLYIKLAKSVDRNILEKAREFVLGQENVVTRGKLFMWKLTRLRKEEELNSDNK